MTMNQATDSQPSSREVTILEVWDVLWRYKFLIIGITVLFAVTSIVRALNATEIYRAETVVVEAQREGDGRLGGVSGQLSGLASLAGISIGAGSGGQENIAILRSWTLAEEFITRNDLIDEILPTAAPESKTLWRAVERFRDRILSITVSDRDRLITIAIEHPDPAVAARWANDYAALANEILRDRSIHQAESNLTFLNQRIEEGGVVELDRVVYGLIEAEMRNLMFANVREEFAFASIDRARVPEQRVRPQRAMMVITGTFAGGTMAVLLAFLLAYFKVLRQAKQHV